MEWWNDTFHLQNSARNLPNMNNYYIWCGGKRRACYWRTTGLCSLGRRKLEASDFLEFLNLERKVYVTAQFDSVIVNTDLEMLMTIWTETLKGRKWLFWVFTVFTRVIACFLQRDLSNSCTCTVIILYVDCGKVSIDLRRCIQIWNGRFSFV